LLDTFQLRGTLSITAPVSPKNASKDSGELASKPSFRIKVPDAETLLSSPLTKETAAGQAFSYTYR